MRKCAKVSMVAFALGILACGCNHFTATEEGADEGSVATTQQNIFNGETTTPAAAGVDAVMISSLSSSGFHWGDGTAGDPAKIIKGASTGSGIALNSRWILTNAHVVERLASSFTFTEGNTPPATVPYEAIPAADIEVRLGTLDANYISPPVARADAVYIHLKHSPIRGKGSASGDIDVALLHLAEDLRDKDGKVVNSTTNISGQTGVADIIKDINSGAVTIYGYGMPDKASVLRKWTPTITSGAKAMGTTRITLTSTPADPYIAAGDSGGPWMGFDGLVRGITVAATADELTSPAITSVTSYGIPSSAFKDWAEFEMAGGFYKWKDALGYSNAVYLYQNKPTAVRAYLAFGDPTISDLGPAEFVVPSALEGKALTQVTGGQYGSNHLAALFGGTLVDYAIGTSTTALALGTPRIMTTHADYVSVSTVDFNVNGVDDAVAVRQDGTMDLYLGTTGTGLSTTAYPAFAKADFDGNGDPDRMSLNGSSMMVTYSYGTTGSTGQLQGQISNSSILSGTSTMAVTGNFQKMEWETVPTSTNPVIGAEMVLLLNRGLYRWTTPTRWTSANTTGGPVGKDAGGSPWIGGGSAGTASAVRSVRAIVGAGDPGYDGLEVVMDDGSIRRYKGTATGLVLVTDAFVSAIPSADANDGKFITISHGPTGTLNQPLQSMRVVVPAGQTTMALDVFDGDLAGYYDSPTVPDSSSTIKACYRLSKDPCGDRQLNCMTGGSTGVVATINSSITPNAAWATIYNDVVHADAKSPSGNYVYRLDAFLSNDNCATTVAEGVQSAIRVFDGFKIKATGALSVRAGSISIIGYDSVGANSRAPDVGWDYPDTTYDGIFDLYFNVGSAGEVQPQAGNGVRWLHLTEADADHTDAIPPGNAYGSNSTIGFSVVNPFGLTELACSSADGVLPSGNYDEAAGDYGIQQYDVQPIAGQWRWHWHNIDSVNNVFLFAVTGSPITYDLFGQALSRPAESGAISVADLIGRSDLPSSVVLGEVDANGTTIGYSVILSGLSSYTSILSQTGTIQAEFMQQLLAANLNLQLAAQRGENLGSALLYGSVVSVRSVIRNANAMMRDGITTTSPSVLARTVQLLRAVNQGEVTYSQTGLVRFDNQGTDTDGDGVSNMRDNCPTVVNPSQLDLNGDGVGDACSILPIATCVRETTTGKFTAYFGYNNPVEYRHIGIGSGNYIDGTADQGQPTEFGSGTTPKAFAVNMGSSSSVTWHLDGQSSTATTQSPRCSGGRMVDLGVGGRVAVFGAEQVTLADRAKLITMAGAYADAVSAGATELGADSKVGNLWSRGDTTLRSNSTVNGNLYTGTLSTPQAEAKVLGQTAVGRYFQLNDISVYRDIPTANDLYIAPDQTTVTLPPGTYGSVTIGSRSTLRLVAGEYLFKSLLIESQATLSVDDADGDVTVYLSQGITHRGTMVGTTAAVPRLFMNYLGTEPISFVEAPFSGLFLAPRASIILGGNTGIRHIGQFYAKRIEVRADVVVQHYDF